MVDCPILSFFFGAWPVQITTGQLSVRFRPSHGQRDDQLLYGVYDRIGHISNIHCLNHDQIMLDPYKILMTRSLWDPFPIFGQALIIGHPRLTRPSRTQPGYLEDLRSTEVSPNCSCETRLDREEVNGAQISRQGTWDVHVGKRVICLNGMYQGFWTNMGLSSGKWLFNGVYLYIYISGIQQGSVEIISWDIFHQFDIICLCV